MTEAKQCCDKEKIPSGNDVTGCRMTTADRGPQICFLLFFVHIANSILLCSASPAAINLSEKQNKNMTKTCLKYK